MKILHINRNYVTTPLHQVMMAHLEQQKELENTVFAPTDMADPDVECYLKNTDVCVSNCFSKLDRFVFDLKQHKIISALEHNLDVRNFDCIHAYTLFTDGNCAMKLSEKYEIPYIIAVRSTDVNEFFKKLPYLRSRGIRIMEHASAICFLSESYRKRVFDQYVPEQLQLSLKEKSYIIPNGIDDFWHEHCFTEKRELHDPVRLIYAGKIMARKNVEVAVAAVEELSRQNVNAELTVVGAIQDQSIYDRITHYDFVHYHEAVPKEELIDFYRKNDIFVMPSYAETFGLVYAEAMSQGLPVIYTKDEGFDGQFPEGEVGYHVDAKSAESVARAVISIVENYESITDEVTEKTKKFTWSNICRKYGEIYRNLGKQ